jgi:hypothetical protein
VSDVRRVMDGETVLVAVAQAGARDRFGNEVDA